jgi:hypothetical protein
MSDSTSEQVRYVGLEVPAGGVLAGAYVGAQHKPGWDGQPRLGESHDVGGLGADNVGIGLSRARCKNWVAPGVPSRTTAACSLGTLDDQAGVLGGGVEEVLMGGAEVAQHRDPDLVTSTAGAARRREPEQPGSGSEST